MEVMNKKCDEFRVAPWRVDMYRGGVWKEPNVSDTAVRF